MVTKKSDSTYIFETWEEAKKFMEKLPKEVEITYYSSNKIQYNGI